MRLKNTVKRLTDNEFLFTILTKIFAVAIGLVASSFSNRFLGPDLKGELGRISSLLSVIAVIANFGLYQPYPYYKHSREPEVEPKFLRIFSLQFLLYMTLGLVGFFLFDRQDFKAVCLLAPVQVLANQLSFVIMVENVRFKNVIFMTARITNTLVIIIAYFTLQRTIMVSLILVAIGDLITIALTFWKLRIRVNPFKADLKFAARIIPFGLVAMMTTLMVTINYRVDTLMMGYLYGIPDAEIGFYTLGVSLSEYAWLIPDAFREVLFSHTAKSDDIGEVTMSLKINLYLSLLMIAGILILGRPVIWLLSGAEFMPAFPVTVLLMAGIIPMGYFKIIGTLLQSRGRQNIYLAMLTGSVVANIIANALMIPVLGKMGAALASVLSYSVAGLLFLIYYCRVYKISLRSVFLLSADERRAIRGKLGRIPRRLHRT